MPWRMTCRDMPVARETAETPPRPIAALSAAATSRRERSSRIPRTAAKRRVIPVRSAIPSRIRQNNSIWKCYFVTSLRPLAYGIQPQIDGNTVEAPTFFGTGLMLFAEPPEQNPPKLGDANVVDIMD